MNEYAFMKIMEKQKELKLSNPEFEAVMKNMCEFFSFTEEQAEFADYIVTVMDKEIEKMNEVKKGYT